MDPQIGSKHSDAQTPLGDPTSENLDLDKMKEDVGSEEFSIIKQEIGN